MTSYYLPSDSKIGAGYMAHRLANTLASRGHSVTMFSPCRRTADAGYEHVAVPMSGSLRTFRWAARIRDLDLRTFDVLHAHGDNHLRTRRGPPQVRTLHGSCFSEAIHIRGAKARLRMAALGVTEIVGSVVAEVTIAVSNNSRTFYPWVKQVIPNGVERGLFRPGPKENRPTILFVGTFGQRKRGRLLMEVFQDEIVQEIPDARLWMVCSDAPKAPNVEVLGRLDDESLADRYRRAWVFCLPSTYEGFGVPYIEAMASGTPVVASANPGAIEILDHGRFGMIADDAEMGAALLGLLRDRSRRESLAVAGVDRSAEFDWPVVAMAYERVYEELLRSRD